MKEINAFVGHSFRESDASLVRQFLDYFDSISHLHPTFSWNHAEAAEPRELAAKVLAQMDGKNVFIGICTKSECVAEGQLLRIPFQNSYCVTQYRDLSWKTSDWMIQEIGLAKGRGLELILLVERGLRKPGGLQGDVEHIEFDRSAPEKSFGKILEMITALSPKTKTVRGAPADTSSAAANRDAAPIDKRWATPAPSWTRDNYELAIFRMVAAGDEKGAESIDQAYLMTDHATEDDNKATWQARIEWLRVLFGSSGNIGKIKELATRHPKSWKVLSYLGKCYAEYEEYESAAETFLAAESLAEGREDEQTLKGEAAIFYAKAGQPDRAFKIVRELKAGVASGVYSEVRLLEVMRRIAEGQKNQSALLAILERSAELSPEDLDIRFSLAYRYSENGNNDLALTNYLKVPYQMRSAMVWNNLGVAFDEFSMPGKAVSAFLRAVDSDETLAMSNLARKWLSLGFVREAQEMCDRAVAMKDYHKNVSHVLSMVRDLPDKEDEKLSELQNRTKPKAEFFSRAGRAITSTEPNELRVRWKGPRCELELKRTGDRVRLVGRYEQTNALAAWAGTGGGANIVSSMLEIFRG